MGVFKPMLSGKVNPETLTFPKLASVKLDGIRILIRDGAALSRTLKPIPNQFVQRMLGKPEFEGLDGEIVVGPANAPDVYLKTNSGVMSVSGEPNFTYVVFDRWDQAGKPFHERLPKQEFVTDRFGVSPLEHVLIRNSEELHEFQERALEDGYEGVMLRAQDGPYKHGRSTEKEGWLLKMKITETDEARVVSVVEEFQNLNEATTDALGRTKRSSHKENKAGKNRLGALVVECIHTGVVFEVGSGFTAQEREDLWKDPPIGRLISYNHIPHGRKDRPRHPTWKGLRDPIDVGDPA